MHCEGRSRQDDVARLLPALPLASTAVGKSPPALGVLGMALHIAQVYELILQKRKSRVIAQVKLGNTQVNLALLPGTLYLTRTQRLAARVPISDRYVSALAHQVQSLTMSNSGQFLAVNQRGLGRPFQVFPVPLHLCEGAEEEYSDGDDGKAEATDNAEDEPKSKLGQTMDMTERALLSIDGDARPFFIEARVSRATRAGGSSGREPA